MGHTSCFSAANNEKSGLSAETVGEGEGGGAGTALKAGVGKLGGLAGKFLKKTSVALFHQSGAQRVFKFGFVQLANGCKSSIQVMLVGFQVMLVGVSGGFSWV